jgi:universal stress protein A
MYEIRSILVPVDFTDCSRAALDRAIALGNQIGARVTVYHVADISPSFFGLRLATERGGSTLKEHAHVSAKEQLEAFVKEPASAYRHNLEVRVAAGNPRDCILQEAESGKYDLLVMGTHGRTGRAHALAGSVTESIVRTVQCPVMTVRAQG